MLRHGPVVQVVDGFQALQTTQEGVVVLALRLQPLHLGQGSHARQHHVLHPLRRGDVLAPHVGLHAHDVAGLLGREVLGHGFEGVHLLHGRVSTDGQRFVPGLVGLVVVEVHGRVRRHDDVVAQLRTLGTRLGTSPRHDGGGGVDVAAQQFVPADEALALGVQEFLHALREVALQAVFGTLAAFSLDAFVLDALLAERALLPAVARTLVATDVDVLRGEHVGHLAQHVLHKLEHLLLARTEHVGEHAPVVFHLVRAARAAQFGIGSQCCHHVARHVDFRNHGDEAVGSIFHNLAALVLRVETAVALTVVNDGVAAYDGARAPAAHARQLRILLHLEAPALVVSDVPVELVHAVQGNQVDVFLDKLHGIEVARAVQMHAAVGKARLVLNQHCGQADHFRLLLHHGQRLAQRLDAAEHAGSRLAADGDALCRDADAVGLLALNLRIQCQQDVAAGSLREFHLPPVLLAGQLQLRHLAHVVGQEVSVALHVGIAFGIENGRSLAEHEARGRGLYHRLGQGHHVVVSHLSLQGSCR